MHAICFKDANEGMIAGENGFIQITRNSGDDWIVVDDLPVFDVKDIFLMEPSIGYVARKERLCP